MLRFRPARQRGITNFGWLDSRHTFSFGDYFDPANNHYRSLRVINDDRIAGGGGFPTHPHRDMEILSYILAGELQHRDSLGHGTVIAAGEWQLMSAGTGVAHSEFNPSATEPTRLLQIWLTPHTKGLKPRYDQKPFLAAAKRGRWLTIASPDGRDGSLEIRQDAVLAATILHAGERMSYPLAKGRGAWMHVATGSATVNGQLLKDGDAVAIEDETVEVVGTDHGELLVFDLA